MSADLYSFSGYAVSLERPGGSATVLAVFADPERADVYARAEGLRNDVTHVVTIKPTAVRLEVER